jgi:hypothetical protein
MRRASWTLVGVGAVSIVLVLALYVGPSAMAGTASGDPAPLFLSHISTTFTGQSVKEGDTIWFSAIGQLVGTFPTSNLHIEIYNQYLTFTEPNGKTFTQHVPAGTVTFSPTTLKATTGWVQTPAIAGNGIPGWFTTIPANEKGTFFLTGYAYHVGPGGLPGHTKVTWSAEFSGSAAPDCFFDLAWQWGASVYSNFPGWSSSNNYPFLGAEYGSLGVVPADASHGLIHKYSTSDPTGTPEKFKHYQIIGGTAWGCPNYTGTLTSVATVEKPQCY